MGPNAPPGGLKREDVTRPGRKVFAAMVCRFKTRRVIVYQTFIDALYSVIRCFIAPWSAYESFQVSVGHLLAQGGKLSTVDSCRPAVAIGGTVM